MSLSGAMTSAITGIDAQSRALGAISDNISNSQTTGYKRVDTEFSTLLTVSNAFVHEPGGVTSKPLYTNGLQGTVQQTSVPTNLAVSGEGYFAVSRSAGANGTALPTFEADPLYTRAGDFAVDQNGFLVNSSGYFLNGWKVDPSTGQVAKNELVQIRLNQLKSDPQATASVNYSANLPTSPDASLNVGATLPGQTLTLTPATPVAPAVTSNFTDGDQISVTQSGVTTTFIMNDVPNDPTTGLPGAPTITAGPNQVVMTFDSTAAPTDTPAGVLNALATTLTANGFTATVDANGKALDIVGTATNPLTTASGVIQGAGGSASSVASANVGNVIPGEILTFSTTPAAPTFTSGDTISVTQGGTTTTFIMNDTKGGNPPIPPPTAPATSPVGVNYDSTLAPTDTNAGILNALVEQLSKSGLHSSLDENGNLSIVGTTGNPATAVSATLAAGTALSSAATNIEFASNNVNFFDAQGAAHPIEVNWTKVAGTDDTYRVTYTSNDPTIINITPTAPATIVFNVSDNPKTGAKAGSIKSINGFAGVTGSPASVPISVHFGGGTATSQAISFGLGAFGVSEQTTMFTGTDVNFVSAQQDGLPPGAFRNLDIDSHGLITLNFDNGARKSEFEVPLVQFSNYDGLQPQNGNAFSTTVASGTPSIHAAGDNGTGTLIASSVEGADVDIAAEFTKLIQTQRAYEANTKVITAVNDLLQQTNNLIR